MNKLIKRKSLKYLREHNIIKDDEEPPQDHSQSDELSMTHTIANHMTGPKINAIDQAFSTVWAISFVFAIGFLIYSYFIESTAYHLIWVIVGLVLLMALELLLNNFRKNSFNKKHDPSENYLLEVPIEISEKSKVDTELTFIRWVCHCIIVIAPFPLLYRLALDPYINKFTYFIGLTFVFFSSILLMYYIYKLIFTRKYSTHHFITSKRIYYTPDIIRQPYISMNISDITTIEIIAEDGIRIARTTRYTYTLRYLTKNQEKDNPRIEIPEKFANKSELKLLFPNVEFKDLRII